MKKNRISLIAIILGFTFFNFSVSAEEIEMTCTFKHKEFYDGKLQTKRLRYTDPIFTEKKILQFRDGQSAYKNENFRRLIKQSINWVIKETG